MSVQVFQIISAVSVQVPQTTSTSRIALSVTVCLDTPDNQCQSLCLSRHPRHKVPAEQTTSTSLCLSRYPRELVPAEERCQPLCLSRYPRQLKPAEQCCEPLCPRDRRQPLPSEQHSWLSAGTLKEMNDNEKVIFINSAVYVFSRLCVCIYINMWFL